MTVQVANGLRCVAQVGELGVEVGNTQIAPQAVGKLNGVFNFNAPGGGFTGVAGKEVKAGAHADRNGFLFITDRSKLTKRTGGEANKPTSLIAAYPFVPGITWAKGFDLKTGRPIVNFDQYPPEPAAGEKQGKKIQVTPNFLGGQNWNPMSYHPDTGFVYIPSNHWT